VGRSGSQHDPAGRVLYVCQECGYESPKWLGRCPSCTGWNTFAEEVRPPRGGERRPLEAKSSAPVPLAEVVLDAEERLRVGLPEVDRVLGGGIVPGSLILLGGEPGSGKSTLALQIAHRLGPIGPVLYVSGEESPRQTKLRAARLGVDGPRLLVLAETDLSQIAAQIGALAPVLVVIDSIQTVYRPDLPGAPGSVGQIRESTGDLLRIAKAPGGPAVLIIGHVTKDGTLAGPRVLEHMVDTVLYFEGERHHAYRVLRTTKNRFGSTNEVGIFAMSGRGLVEVPDPSAVLLAERPAGASGSAVVCAVEGTRPLLLEVQALVARTSFGVPRRTAAGVDYNRLVLLLAVLEKRAGLHLSASDVYVNVAGGVHVDEPAADLGIACAVASSHRDRPVEPATVIVGEVGLGGEVRAVSQAARRIGEAAKLGFRRILLPRGNVETLEESVPGIEVVGVQHLGEALAAVLQ